MPARTLTTTRPAAGTTTHQPTRVVLYVRVSSKDQEAEGFSIPAQVRLLREYAASKGFVIDGYSKTSKPPRRAAERTSMRCWRI